MKTFKQLLNECNFDKVLENLKNSSEIKNIESFNEGYSLVFEQLKWIPYVPSPWSKIKVIRGEDTSKETFDGKVLVVDELGEEFAAEFEKWESMLNVEVESEYGVDETVAYLLYEITFFGFDKNESEKKIQDIKGEWNKDLDRIDKFNEYCDKLGQSTIDNMSDEELDSLFDNFDKE